MSSELIVPFLDGLPIFPSTVTRFQRILNSLPIDLADATEELTSDVALCARVLRHVASASGLNAHCPALDECIVLMGTSALADVVHSATVIETEVETCSRMRELTHHSRQVALIAKRIAIACEYPRPDHAHIAGLLHDLGLIAMLVRSDVLFNDAQTLGRTLGVSLANNWCLPPFIADVIEHISSPTSARVDPFLAAIVACAHCFSGHSAHQCWSPEYEALDYARFFQDYLAMLNTGSESAMTVSDEFRCLRNNTYN